VLSNKKWLPVLRVWGSVGTVVQGPIGYVNDLPQSLQASVIYVRTYSNKHRPSRQDQNKVNTLKFLNNLSNVAGL